MFTCFPLFLEPASGGKGFDLKVSKSRIKRLRGISRPEYRLSVGDFRIFYDVKETKVEILAIVPKSRAAEWLERYGEQE